MVHKPPAPPCALQKHMLHTARQLMLVFTCAAWVAGLTGCAQTADISTPSAASQESTVTAAPQAWSISDWQKEVISDKPGATHVRYFTTDDSGQEQVMLELDQITQECDLDGDGHPEIIVSLFGPVKQMAIYYVADSALQYLDICQALDAQYSTFMGDVGNVKPEYSSCFSVGFEAPGGKAEVYRFENHALVYQCPLEDALLG